jgi:hypothetical protein
LRGSLDTRGPEAYGIGDLTAASIFKRLLEEALIGAGVTDRPTLLDEANRRASLGTALQWGMKLLLAYALEVEPRAPRRGIRDLRWIGALLRETEPSLPRSAGVVKGKLRERGDERELFRNSS